MPAEPAADVVITADPDTVVGLLTGRLTPDRLDPAASGRLCGSDDALRRLTHLAHRARYAGAAGLDAAS